jgi:hypothetical protein
MLDLKNHNLLSMYSLLFQNICQGKLNIDLYLGVFYITIHVIYITLIVYNILFTTNITNTFILLIIIFMNFYAVFLLKTCPIILLEKKYINTTYLKILFYNENENENENEEKENEEIKDKKKEKIKVISKYLDYYLDEITLQGLITSGIIISIKLLILFCMK